MGSTKQSCISSLLNERGQGDCDYIKRLGTRLGWEEDGNGKGEELAAYAAVLSAS
jgi:hypothetical protein